MTNPTTSRLSALLCAVTLLAPVATPFGDNDGGLDLPGAHGATPAGGSDDTSSNSVEDEASDVGSTSISVAFTQALTVDGQIVDVALRDEVGALLLTDVSLGDSQSLGLDQPASALQVGGQDAAASQVGDDVALQGSLVVPADLLGSALMLPPAAASASAALIVIDSDDDSSLDDLLAGHVLLDAWHLTGVPVALDLGHFAGLVDQLGPGVHVSFVIASVDAAGGLHLSATRVDTTDGQVEYASF